MLAEKIEIPVVSEYITKDKYWFANFTYKGYSYLLLNGFDQVKTESWLELKFLKSLCCMLEAKVVNTTLSWKNLILFSFISRKRDQRIQGPWFTSLCYRFTTLVTYKVFLEQLLLSSLSLLRKLANGGLGNSDSVIRKWCNIRGICSLHRWNPFTKRKSSIAVESLLEQIKIVSRKNSIPFVVKSLPETSVSEQWFGEPTYRSVYDLNIINTQITTINTKIYLTLFLKLKKGYLIYLRKY